MKESNVSRSPRLDKIEEAAEKVGVPAYYLLIPGMDEEALHSPEIDQLISIYLQQSPKERAELLGVAMWRKK